MNTIINSLQTIKYNNYLGYFRHIIQCFLFDTIQCSSVLQQASSGGSGTIIKVTRNNNNNEKSAK